MASRPRPGDVARLKPWKAGTPRKAPAGVAEEAERGAAAEREVAAQVVAATAAEVKEAEVKEVVVAENPPLIRRRHHHSLRSLKSPLRPREHRSRPADYIGNPSSCSSSNPYPTKQSASAAYDRAK